MTPTTADRSTLAALIDPVVPQARAIRHELHRHPELNYEERRTSETIRRELEAIGVQFQGGVARGTGVVAYLPATSPAPRTRTIALRADIDALPIHEQTGLEYASQTPGKMHACGHDGHTAMLLATARALSSAAHRPNHVLMLFQPAEEGGAGGLAMCEDGALDGSLIGTPADVIFGQHGWPDMPVGTVATRTGPLMASTDEFLLTIRGKGGHAAHPETTIDPIVVASHLVVALQTIVSRRTEPNDASVVTVGRIAGGFAQNVIPDTVVLEGTLRALTDHVRATNEREFKRIIEGVCATYGATPELDWQPGYPSVHNHPGATDHFRAVAAGVMGEHAVHERPRPTMGGEDFSYYGRHIPACFFFLGLRPPGADSYPNLHTPRFDFNDAALPHGIALFTALALQPVPEDLSH
ncbi:MAG: M20 metallopeptidase family protein [Phycisphaerales bacterium]